MGPLFSKVFLPLLSLLPLRAYLFQTVFHHLEKVICVCFSHLWRFGRRPNHPSILLDGWTASEKKLSQKFKEFNKLSRRPSFPFVSIICRQSKIFLSVCLDCGLAVFFLLAAFLSGTLDNRENVCLHFSLSISDLFVYIATMKCWHQRRLESYANTVKSQKRTKTSEAKAVQTAIFCLFRFRRMTIFLDGGNVWMTVWVTETKRPLFWTFFEPFVGKSGKTGSHFNFGVA